MGLKFTDQLGYTINLPSPPKKIISLVPSQTELLFDLGLDKEIIGITKFCIHPLEKCKTKVKIGGTKTLNIEQIRAMQPDLIIGNKEENTKEDIELLRKEFPVWISDVSTLEDAMKTITEIAELVDREPEGAYLNHLINAGFTDLQTLALQYRLEPRTIYLMWKDPYMMAAADTFIGDILMKAGLVNIAKGTRYPETTLEELQLLSPELILLSSEPYPFRDKHISELKSAIPGADVRLIDGEMISWYGSRLVKTVGYLFDYQKSLK
ncbi:ABC transporter substrate-binding protein [Pedobacter antarcticus]|uniref:ABC transporter substrate-binding protein n=1 Tax=Pedobacter antarcticus TaxID=34086 RepID=UPI000882D0FB|nr:helical backbone metal receptor [Pedobacter antarcticus]SDM28981.1 substrate-binding protein [Pedobacter antarcticus]